MLLNDFPYVPQWGDSQKFAGHRPLFKGSKTDSSQSSSNVSKDNSTVAEDEAQVVSDGSAVAGGHVLNVRGAGDDGTTNVTVNSTDTDTEILGIAADYAAGLTDRALILVEETTEDAFDVASDSLGRAFDFGEDALDFADETNQLAHTTIQNSTNATLDIAKASIEAAQVNLRTRSEDEQAAARDTAETLIKFGAFALVGVAAAAAVVAVNN